MLQKYEQRFYVLNIIIGYKTLLSCSIVLQEHLEVLTVIKKNVLAVCHAARVCFNDSSRE